VAKHSDNFMHERKTSLNTYRSRFSYKSNSIYDVISRYTGLVNYFLSALQLKPSLNRHYSD